MPLAFVPHSTTPLTLVETSSPLRSCQLRGRRVRVVPSVERRAILRRYTACATVKKDSDAVNEEEQLDEAAMRAAEIHEVLTGLKDFKTRIIDDATKLAKKVRAPKKQLDAALASHPDIIKIDGHIAELEEELRVLGDR